MFFTMGWRKSGNFPISLLGFASLVALTSCYCPDYQVCDCSSDSVKCICRQREDVKFLEEDEDEEVFIGKEVIIEGCGKVEIMKLSLKDVNLETVYISDVLELHVEPYTFDGSHIGNLHIHNISELYLKPYSLGSIKTIFSLIINNATVESLPPSILGDTEINNASIVNSHIGTVSSKALLFQNLETLSLENNVINALDIRSIAVRDARNFEFTRNMVVQSSFGSISVSTAGNVEFGYCTFGHIHSSMIITTNVDVFSFNDNHIDHCDERAFWSIQANQKVRFLNNQILIAREDCLLPNLGPNAMTIVDKVESVNNTFTCDCELEWLLINENPSYSVIKDQGFCSHPPHLSGLKLSHLRLSMDNYGTCIDLVPFDTPVPTPASTMVPTITEQRLTSKSTKPPSITRRQRFSIKPSIPTTTLSPEQPKVKEKYVSKSAETYSRSPLMLLLFILAICWM